MAAAVVAAALLAMAPARPVLVGLLVVALLLGVLEALATRPRVDRLVDTGDGFTTPPVSVPVTFGLINLCMLTIGFVLGVRDPGVPPAPWLALLGAYAALPVLYGYGLWHGVGVTLAPDGLHIAKLTGSVFVPWVALHPEQYAQDPADADRGRVVLRIARPELVTTRGWPIDPDRMTVAGVRRDHLAAVIQMYVAEPPAAGVPIPAASRAWRIRNVLAGLALVAVAGPLYVWTSTALEDVLVDDLPNLWAYAALAGPVLLLRAAISRRPAAAAPLPAPEPSRPRWARDVTKG